MVLVLLISFISIQTKSATIDDNSNSCILMDIDHNRILYENNIYERQLTASIAKIMTCIVAIENGNLDKLCTVTEETTRQVGSSIYLQLNDKISLIDLLYGLMLRSGNDAAYLISINICNSVDEFVSLMNKTAKKINMNNTSFENPSGLDENSKNYSTAYDMAILMAYAMKNETFRKITSTKNHTVRTHNNNLLTFKNKHKLIQGNQYCISGKTGYTESAKRTLVSCFSKNNINIVVVTFNCGNDWSLHEQLFEYAINNYTNKTFINKGILNYEFINYNVTPIIYEDVNYLVRYTENVKCEIELLNNQENNEIIGIIKLYLNNEVVKEIFIYRYY